MVLMDYINLCEQYLKIGFDTIRSYLFVTILSFGVIYFSYKRLGQANDEKSSKQSTDGKYKDQMVEARLKMQKKYEEDAKRHAIAKKEEEEKKKQQNAENNKTKLNNNSDKKTRLNRSDYHPLSGGGEFRTYRPPKKGSCGRSCG